MSYRPILSRGFLTKGLVALVAAASLVTAAGCNAGSNLDNGANVNNGGGADTSGTTAKGNNTTITIGGDAGPFQDNFNPFSPNVRSLTQGVIYEPLFYFNQLKPIDQKPVPMLGTSYSWNKAGTQLTIKVRSGVTWSDGKPFTAKDVAFTFNLIQKTPELNTTGHSPKATLVDDDTVRLSYDQPSFADGPNELGRTYMVPEHLWSKIKKPVTYANKKPVGTGAFELSDFTQQSYLLKANPDYWQQDKPAIGGVRYISLSGNQAATDKYLAGEIDYQSSSIPNLDKLIKNKPKLSYVNTGTAQAAIFTCSNAKLGCTGPQTDPAVRRAMYLGMDRTQLNNLAFYKLGKPVSPSFALPERDKDFISPDIKNAPQTADVAAAKKVLENAGYKLQKGVYSKNGKPLKMTLKVVSGWTDYITAVDTMKEQFGKIGIQIVPQQVSQNEWNAAKTNGKFELLIDSLGQGPAPDPYYLYNTFFSNTVAVGKNGNPYGNSSRFSNSKVDAALKTAAGTDDTEVKKKAYFTIQKIISADLPYIPIIIGSTLTEFNTSKVTGFPSKSDMYAYPPAWSAPDNAQVLMNLKPVK